MDPSFPDDRATAEQKFDVHDFLNQTEETPTPKDRPRRVHSKRPVREEEDHDQRIRELAVEGNEIVEYVLSEMRHSVDRIHKAILGASLRFTREGSDELRVEVEDEVVMPSKRDKFGGFAQIVLGLAKELRGLSRARNLSTTLERWREMAAKMRIDLDRTQTSYPPVLREATSRALVEIHHIVRTLRSNTARLRQRSLAAMREIHRRASSAHHAPSNDTHTHRTELARSVQRHLKTLRTLAEDARRDPPRSEGEHAVATPKLVLFLSMLDALFVSVHGRDMAALGEAASRAAIALEEAVRAGRDAQSTFEADVDQHIVDPQMRSVLKTCDGEQCTALLNEIRENLEATPHGKRKRRRRFLILERLLEARMRSAESVPTWAGTERLRAASEALSQIRGAIERVEQERSAEKEPILRAQKKLKALTAREMRDLSRSSETFANQKLRVWKDAIVKEFARNAERMIGLLTSIAEASVRARSQILDVARAAGLRRFSLRDEGAREEDEDLDDGGSEDGSEADDDDFSYSHKRPNSEFTPLGEGGTTAGELSSLERLLRRASLSVRDALVAFADDAISRIRYNEAGTLRIVLEAARELAGIESQVRGSVADATAVDGPMVT